MCSMAPKHCTMLLVINTSTCSSKWRLGSCINIQQKYTINLYKLNIYWNIILHILKGNSKTILMQINVLTNWKTRFYFYKKCLLYICLPFFQAKLFYTCLPTFFIASCSGVIFSSSSNALNNKYHTFKTRYCVFKEAGPTS